VPGLADILRATEVRVRALRPRRASLERAAADAPGIPRWTEVFGEGSVVVIGEIKRRSPSAGLIAAGLDPARHARAYVAGGARAVSVLTDEVHFGGTLEDLRDVRAAVGVPVLRKDFIIDPIQVYESRAAGASAILLIVRALGREQLRELAAVAVGLGLARLVEVHTAEELERAASLAPEAIGVNSRDLETFDVSPEAVAPLLGAVPGDVIAVAESGIATRTDVERAAGWGADAVLVGTSVARDPDPEGAVRRLAGVPRGQRRGVVSSGARRR
jgi:indole-3-glycerol phosphate synthase